MRRRFTALSDAIDKAQAQTGVTDTGANRWLIWQEMDAQAAYDADSADASDAIEPVDKAMDAVTGSMDAKTLADAEGRAAIHRGQRRQDLRRFRREGAGQCHARQSEGRVGRREEGADDDSVTDAKEYTDQKTAVDGAVKAVNDSIAAKEKADAEAKAQAAADAAAASSGPPVVAHTTAGSTGSGSTPAIVVTPGGPIMDTLLRVAIPVGAVVLPRPHLILVAI